MRKAFDSHESGVRPARSRRSGGKWSVRRWPIVGAAQILALCVSVAGSAATPTTAPASPASGPTVLADAQLDSITAGTMTVAIDLVALARGRTAFTSTMASLQSVHGKILMTDMRPGSTRQQMVDLAYGYGVATAAGNSASQCSATPRIDGPVIFTRISNTQITTPSLAICSCSLISIGLSR